MRLSRTCLVLILLAAPLPAGAQQAILVVRHAEKQSDSNDPPTPLSQAGIARAQRLAEILRDSGVTAIYSTDTVRTRSTAEPLARMRGLTVQVYSARNAEGKLDPGLLVKRLRQASPQDVVLVVGHGDTVGPLLTALGWRGEIQLGAAEYDNLFVVVPRRGGPPGQVRLRY